MNIATQGGKIIVKDGKLAEDCGCCGGWYCYKCDDGFAVDCKNFGEVSINGNSTFEPPITASTTSAGIGGCFEVDNANLFQRKSSTMCELWSSSPGFDDCAKGYQRWTILPTDTVVRQTTPTGEATYTDPGIADGSVRIQSRFSVRVGLIGGEQCGDVRTKYRINAGGAWEIYLVFPFSSSTLWDSYLLFSEFYGTTREITPADLAPDGTFTIPTSSIFTTTPTRLHNYYRIVSPRPPDMDIVLTPTIYPARCNDK